MLPPLRLSESHVGAVKAVAFGAKVNEYFATCGSDSTVRVWDASDYTVRMQASVNIGGVVPSCVALTLDSEIALSGWSDGKVRAYLVSPEDQASAGGMLAWQIDNVASGRGLSQIVLSNNERFFVTGDHSGMVCLCSSKRVLAEKRLIISHLLCSFLGLISGINVLLYFSLPLLDFIQRHSPPSNKSRTHSIQTM